MAPTFSVILTTWNRGRHIVPTIKSVLQQTFTDYELLIIGDGCDDETEAVVRPYLSERVIWRNLLERAGHQATPNNAGLAAARGRYVAYLGHDDLWSPEHLSQLHRVFTGCGTTAVAISGCACYGPPGSGVHMVAGIFDDDRTKFEQFFPPSSVSHDRDLIDQIGVWRRPEEIRASPDIDFLQRAAHAGIPFASTGVITTHKFPAGHSRYLCYLRQESVEQEHVLRMMAEPGFPAFVEQVSARAKAIGLYMRLFLPDIVNVPVGHHSAIGRISRGLSLPPLVMLGDKAVFGQSDEYRAFDWQQMMEQGSFRGRWSGPNPRPKLLIPVATRNPVELRIQVLGVSDVSVFDRLSLTVNAQPTDWSFRRDYDGRKAVLSCRTRLNPNRHSVLEFDLAGGASLDELVRCVEGRPERIAIGDVSARRAQSRGWAFLPSSLRRFARGWARPA